MNGYRNEPFNRTVHFELLKFIHVPLPPNECVLQIWHHTDTSNTKHLKLRYTNLLLHFLQQDRIFHNSCARRI